MNTSQPSCCLHCTHPSPSEAFHLHEVILDEAGFEARVGGEKGGSLLAGFIFSDGLCGFKRTPGDSEVGPLLI